MIEFQKDKVIKLFFAVAFSALSLGKAYAGVEKDQNIPGLVYWHGDINKPQVALTFDDGPNEPYTSEILDILKRYNAKATFFVLGKNVELYPNTAKRITDEGHAIGNHTYDHPYLLIQSKSHIKNELEKTEQTIFRTTNTRPFLFRPPYGVEDNWLYNVVKQEGYITVEWSVTGHNGGRDTTPERIVNDTLNGVVNGSIILLHDGNRLIKRANRGHTVAALPSIIESLQRKGFKLVTVTELLGLNNQGGLK